MNFSSLNSTYWNLVFQVEHLSFLLDTWKSFELHLLESGISGKVPSIGDLYGKVRLNSTYWNLVFQDVNFPLFPEEATKFELHLLESGISGFAFFPITSASFMFELHLLESGISGILSGVMEILAPSLNSTYWNLVFQDN